MSEVLVSFMIGKTKVKTNVSVPKIGNKEGIRVMTINNAVKNIKMDLNINLHDVFDEEEIYNHAVIEYQ